MDTFAPKTGTHEKILNYLQDINISGKAPALATVIILKNLYPAEPKLYLCPVNFYCAAEISGNITRFKTLTKSFGTNRIFM